MKILFLTTHLRFGGITTYVASLAGRFHKNGHKVYAASCGGDMVSDIEKAGVEHIQMEIDTSSELNPILIPAGLRLRAIIKEYKIDVIHAHTRVTQVLSNLVCRTLSPSLRPVVVTTCHGFFKPKFIRKAFPCWGNKVIAISEPVREHLVNDLRVSKEKIITIHNGIDITQFVYPLTLEQKTDYKKDLGLTEKDKVVGIIARFSPVKGQKYLIKAFEHILKKIPQAYLVMVGDGPDKQMLINLVKELKINKRVLFVPATRDTAGLLAAMDLFVMPSVQEGLGLSIMEAMSAGLPVVASNVGGIYTIVKEGQTGFLVHPEDDKSLAAAVIKVLESPLLCKEIGEQGRKLMETDFSIDTMAQAVEEVYKELIRE
ncbi:MAG: glycosyltransferase family 4 protein [Candidatus Omnitrophica bacterium]|nr:glycosyltransferase family 4 protein [Candidatus Omnitrophota bacterium]